MAEKEHGPCARPVAVRVKQARLRALMQDPGRPRFVSMLVYLNSAWPLDHGAETLFLDGSSDSGLYVRPRPGRVVLMDQDIVHRVSAPSPLARRPRFSLVWKLLLSDSTTGGCPSLLLPRHGPPASHGSAHRLRVAQTKLAGGERS